MKPARSARQVVFAVLLGGILASSPFAPGVAPAGAWSEGPCPTADGVTVVIDFQELGGGIWVRCAPGPSNTGFEALQRAGVPYGTTVRFPGFLCKIDGKPTNDPCQTASPATAYWSYWMAPRGGSWCYSNWGAGNRNPPEGTVEGWSFSLNRTDGTTPTPRYMPPRVQGAPASLPGTDCDASHPTPTAPTATSPPPPVTSAPAGPKNPASGGDASGGTGKPARPAATTTPPAASAPGATGTEPDVAAETTVPVAEGAPTSTEPPAADPSTPSTIVTADGEEVAINARGSSTSTDATSSPIGVIVTVVLLASLAGTAYAVRRRARAA